MSIQELIARNQRGLPLSGKQPIFTVAEDATDDDAFHIAVNRMQNMDLAEREALQDQLQERIATLKQKAEHIAKEQRKAQEAALIAADEAQLKKLQARLESAKKAGQENERPA